MKRNERNETKRTTGEDTYAGGEPPLRAGSPARSFRFVSFVSFHFVCFVRLNLALTLTLTLILALTLTLTLTLALTLALTLILALTLPDTNDFHINSSISV